ncbi:MAG: hypothetical protein Q8Q62_20465 [Mesorhizobium sp.]|nr:hypothetical protein [Mesorhizobium sp.]
MTIAPKKKAETSPAVRSLRKEQAQQVSKRSSKGREDDLERGLEDSFPASDPVSAVSTTIAGEAKTTSKHARPM